MAMTHRTFSSLELNDELLNIDNLREQLNLHHHVRTDGEHQLSTIIRLDDFLGNLGGGVQILKGVVFDEYIRTTQRIRLNRQSNNGLPNYIIESDPFVDVRAGAFWFSNDGTLVLQRKVSRPFVSNIISNATDIAVNTTNIDIGRVVEDYMDNWLGGIVDREGNWEKGTLYGENLRADDCIGNEFVACTKNQVGGYTEYFGGSVKFRVTREGVVSVYTDLNEDIETFLRFVRNEIQDYFI